MEIPEFFRVMSWFVFIALMTLVNGVIGTDSKLVKAFTFILFLLGVLVILILLGANFIEMFI